MPTLLPCWQADCQLPLLPAAPLAHVRLAADFWLGASRTRPLQA